MSKLLIVDDEADIREFAARFFQKRGVDVETAENGEEALDKINVFAPDLVLLDIRMSKMTGVEVLKAVRDKGNQTPIIMVSGMEDPQTVNECKALGVLDFIHKPLILEELQNIVMAQFVK